jgi:hypothetical protein
LPPGVVVSIASWRLRNPTPRSARPVTVSERPAEAVELPDDQGVGAGAAGGLGEHPVAAGRCEGVDLELWLLVGGGDAGVAEQMSHAADRLMTL